MKYKNTRSKISRSSKRHTSNISRINQTGATLAIEVEATQAILVEAILGV